MNEEHRALCSSDLWRDLMTDQIMPYALDGVALGTDVLEIGSGPGITTDALRARVPHLTAVEIEAESVNALARRLDGGNVVVLHADAANLPVADDRFTGAVAFTMLHHVPTAALQDRILAELWRVLAPGGVLVLSDSVASEELRALHNCDTYNPVDPTTLPPRLSAAGFTQIVVKANAFGFAAHAHKP